MTESTGTLEKALERNLFEVRHDRLLPLLDFTLVTCSVTRTMSIKPAFQGVGSVPGGSAQCTDEVKTASG